MEKSLMDSAAANGIWAALFVFLFIYVLYDSRRRENKYQEIIHDNQIIIKELSDKFGIVDDIKYDVCFIKDELKQR
ncbi:BhlA/UviB family holin-like peptide [Tissierella carlieri]|uniref:BhlA/UviB family holin-like peptide n=1 Tax=Tissierella carlieri TaxID=689904 RepID=UPI003863CC14